MSEETPQPCPSGAYLKTHTASPLVLAIANDGPFDLSNDTLALALLDSMLDGTTEETRRFYYWVVTRSLKRSDGYYSEGVGSWGTSYLFRHPQEFLTLWSQCLTTKEQSDWAWYLAAEEHIGSEGYPVEEVMVDYQKQLDSSMAFSSTSLMDAKFGLMNCIDSIYRLLAEDDRPLLSSESTE